MHPPSRPGPVVGNSEQCDLLDAQTQWYRALLTQDLRAFCSATAAAALRAGEAEGEPVERVMTEAQTDAHEDAAEALPGRLPALQGAQARR
jgi:hypothetical protein